jgi:glutamate decarboxylase
MSRKFRVNNEDESGASRSFAYAERWETEPIPSERIPENQLDPRAAYQIIHDELNMDGNPALNLASFVTTWMEPEAEKLMTEAANKNYVDQDEYPQTKVIHDRVIAMMADLFNAPSVKDAAGTATIGSSEAIMLGLLAHKWNWKNKKKAEGKDYSKPNVVFGADVHSCWEKFALYFDVEMRIAPMHKEKYTLSVEDVESRIDENTIAVGAVLGTTFTGQVDDIKGINELLIKVNKEKGWDIPIHVDGASGGFIAPFVYPEFEWDFRLERVKSINISNHKFGLVYPGMGTVLFRNGDCIPKDLVFDINYLGGSMLNYSLNFSKASSQVLLQYYNFLRLGRKGYYNIMNNIMENAVYLEKMLLELGMFDILTDTKYLPVVAVKLKESADYTVFEISEELRKRGWIVPAYTLPPHAQDIAVLRMVVKENFSRDMAEIFVKDIKNVVDRLEGESRKRHENVDETKQTKPHHIC